MRITQAVIDQLAERSKLAAQAGTLNTGTMPISGHDVAVMGAGFMKKPSFALPVLPAALALGLAACGAQYLYNRYFATNLNETVVRL